MLAAQQAAASMAGYRPNSAFTPVNNPDAPGLGPETIGHQEDPNALAQQKRMQDMAALEKEYKDNEQRIAQIEAELRNLGTNDMNTLDMQLAQNRAEYGDIANALGHLNRMQVRQSSALDKANANSKSMDALAGEIDNAYVMRAGAKGNEIAAWDNKIERLKAQYKKLAGQDYGFSSPIKTGTVTNPNDVRTVDEYDSLMENYKDKDGRIPEYAIPIAKEILGRLPQGDEVTKRMAELRTGTTQEGHKKAVANKKAKENEAIAAAQKVVGPYEYNNGQKSYTHSNGVTVTIQQKPDGGLEYFVAK
jgi:chromosome segregation ATPase